MIKKDRGSALFLNHWRTWLAEKIASLSFVEERKKKPVSPTTPASKEISQETWIRLYEGMEKACKDTEPDFIHLGQTLEQVYSDATALTRQTLDTVAQIGGKADESVLLRIEQLTKGSLSELEDSHLQVKAKLGHVTQVIGYLNDFHSICSVIERIAMFLRVVGFNMGVECSRSLRSSEMFTVVSHEILLLSDKIIKIARSIRKDAKKTRTDQIRAHGWISRDLRQLRNLAYDTQKAVQHSVREIEQLMKLSLETLKTAGEHTREISDQVGEIVMGIQIHDSMSQRIAHIVSALQEAEDRCKKTGETEFEVTYSIVKLQNAQLAQTISEVDGAYGNTIAAFGKIHGEIDYLTQNLSRFGPSQSQGEAILEKQANDPFKRLQSALSHLRSLLDRGGEMVRRIQDKAVKASEISARLSDHMACVQDISFETHLVALNAIVKAAHLGRSGRTLEVLSTEVKVLSGQTDSFVKNVEKILESISASVWQMRIRPLDQANENESTGGSGSLEEGIREISHAYKQFQTDSQEAFQNAEALKNSISDITANLAFLPNLSDKLSEYHQQLEDMGNALAIQSGELATAASEETNKLADKYTMQQERGVHKQILGPMEHLISDIESELPQEDMDLDDDDDMGDNVELF